MRRVRQLAWLLLAEVVFANMVDATVLLARFLIARSVYAGYDPEPALTLLRDFPD